MSPVAAPPLLARGAIDKLKQAPETFSDWDKCMAKDYCKYVARLVYSPVLCTDSTRWPVIVGIIIGSLIVLSIIACVINCLCCGIQCCKCCACCSCCCPSPRRRPDRTKHLDDPEYYQPPPPPPGNTYRPPPGPPAYRGAQVARFDNSSSSGTTPVNEDALPEMPSWSNARTRRVEDDSQQEDMEMEPLNPAHNRAASPARPNMTPVPATTYANYRGLDDQSSYTPRSPTVPTTSPSPAPFSPYDVGQQYSDYPYGNPYQSRTATPAAPPYTTAPQPYTPMPMAVSSPSEMSRYSPFQRQPSPGVMQPQPPYRGLSPGIPTSSPPPAFTPAPGPYEVSDPAGRPPSLLQSGPKPAMNF